MKIFFNGPMTDDAPARTAAEERVRTVMRRASSTVAHVVVRLVDVNGPRGGRDKRCWVSIKTGQGSSLVVSTIAGDWRTALDDALARAMQNLRRVLVRARQPLRARPGLRTASL